MEFLAVVKGLRDFTASEHFAVHFSKQDLPKLAKALDAIIANIEDLASDRPVTKMADTEDIWTVIKLLDIKLYEEPITPDLEKFIESWSNLIASWNNNTIKDPEIHAYAMKLGRMLDMHFTMLELMTMVKVQTHKLKLFHSRMPPGFELTKSYLDLLKEE